MERHGGPGRAPGLGDSGDRFLVTQHRSAARDRLRSHAIEGLKFEPLFRSILCRESSLEHPRLRLNRVAGLLVIRHLTRITHAEPRMHVPPSDLFFVAKLSIFLFCTVLLLSRKCTLACARRSCARRSLSKHPTEKTTTARSLHRVRVIDKIKKAQAEGRTLFSFDYFPPKTTEGKPSVADRSTRARHSGKPVRIQCSQ